MAEDVIRLGVIHPLRAWLEAFECLLDQLTDVRVVIAHSDPAWVRGAVARGDVDVVIVNLEEASGVPAVRALHETDPDINIVITTDRDDPALVHDAVRAGARGWLPQSAGTKELLTVVHGVARGETWIPPAHLTRLVDDFLVAEERRGHELDTLDRLSGRERQILAYLVRGATRAEIAEALFLSPNTVRTHINHVLRKLEVHSTLAAVSLARKALVVDGTENDHVD